MAFTTSDNFEYAKVEALRISSGAVGCNTQEIRMVIFSVILLE